MPTIAAIVLATILILFAIHDCSRVPALTLGSIADALKSQTTYQAIIRVPRKTTRGGHGLG
jgi:hypothetical protein